MNFNISKSKCMIFRYPKDKSVLRRHFMIEGSPLDIVSQFKYLGFVLNNNLTNVDDIAKSRNKFYIEFNSILRKFSFADVRLKLFLFHSYCLQWYGSELWFDNCKSLGSLRSFAVGYHKAIKKLLNLSYHESNHFACQEAKLLTFENYLNKIRIFSTLRLLIV